MKEVIMKTRSIFNFILTLLSLFSFTTIKAQEEPKGQLYLVHEDMVIPEKVDQYVQAAKGLADIMMKHNNGAMPYWVASRDDFTFIYVIPISGYGAVDMVDKTFTDLEKAVGKETFEAKMNQYDGTFYTHRDFMVRYRADLSYMPDFPADQTFRHWDFYYLDPSKTKEAIQIAKEWKALFEKKKVSSGYRLNIADIGLEPAFIVVQGAKSEADFYKRSQELDKMLGEEGAALMKKTWTVTKKYDHKNGRLHPELSYMPAATSKK
ncbi:hypothetical protein [Solitalea lacus]|uniref:hypothetical protein n=1 Tax=Solitalea lacus TaxID=2911172 RepID=UPI001EDA4D6D|nr:hypothetical protein [Solitalea lacus]UKJ07748.1 hypothetical protein L2B55_00950 [Solitalea lacus]